MKSLVVLILSLFAIFGAAATPVLMFEDVSGELSLEQILSDPQRFQPTDRTSFGFSDSVFWLRIDLKNPTSVQQTQIIQFDFHGLEQVRNCRITERGFQSIDAGWLVSLEQRALGLLLPSFDEVLMRRERRTHYVRVESAAGIDLAYSVLST